MNRSRLASALLFGLAALPGIVVLWGFSVDDAWISVRVADNLALGHGYRFNRDGPVTDAVTPLGWAHLLSLVAAPSASATLLHARVLGALSWLLGAALLGGMLGELKRSSRWVAASALALCLPLAAWAVSGMETPWVVLLGVLALTRSRWAPLAQGCAAAWRPELVPWAVGVSLARALTEEGNEQGNPKGRRPARIAEGLVLAIAPAALVAAIRWVTFGTPVPLAATAKPSDFSAGLQYAVGALLLSGPPWLLLGFGAYRRMPAHARIWLYGFAVHWLAVILAGGDWMSFFRLFAPVLPSVIWLGAELQERSNLRALAARAALVLGSSGLVWFYKAADARAVVSARNELIESARPELGSSSVVAAVDIGWVGAATSATLVDLAGVTDPRIAPLPGGHTTKRVPSSLLIQRRVDTLVFLLAEGATLGSPWYTSDFYYGVDAELAHAARDLGFEPALVLPLPRTQKHYVVLKLAPE